MDIEDRVCYYEILNVPQNATTEDIKQAYRKAVLLYHPDKQINVTAEESKKYTNVFRKIQEAYECLIDDTRRVWYNRNRESLILGKERAAEQEKGKTEGTSYKFGKVNIWPYFNATCFTSFYDDDEYGFFNVYGRLIDEIIKSEEESFERRGRSPINAPRFGNSKTDRKDVVTFYKFWLSFSTVKKFDYSYEVHTMQSVNRNSRRLLKKAYEKKSIRERKEYNENIRSLIMHIRSNDPRYWASMVKVHEQKKENSKDQELVSPRERINQGSQMQQQKKITKEKKKHTENKEGDERVSVQEVCEEESEETYEEAEYETEKREDNLEEAERNKECIIYRCEVCNKNFKSMNQYECHEKSKKHIDNMAKHMQVPHMRSVFEEKKEEENAGGNKEEENTGGNKEEDALKKEAKKKKKHKKKKGLSNDLRKSSLVDKVTIEEKESKKEKTISDEDTSEGSSNTEDLLVWVSKKNKKHSIEISESETEEEETVLIEPKPKNEPEEEQSSEKRKENIEQTHPEKSLQNTCNDMNEESKPSTPNELKESMKNHNKKNKAKKAINVLQCMVCKEKFDTRNKLFMHIKKEGHAALKTEVSTTGKQKKNKK